MKITSLVCLFLCLFVFSCNTAQKKKNSSVKDTLEIKEKVSQTSDIVKTETKQHEKAKPQQPTLPDTVSANTEEDDLIVPSVPDTFTIACKDTFYVRIDNSYKTMTQLEDTIFIQNEYLQNRGLNNSFYFQDSTYYYFEEGTYYVGSWHELSANHLVLDGIGRVNIFCENFSSNVFWVTGDHIRFNNIHFKHFKPDHLSKSQCTGHVLTFHDAHNIIVENCDINGCGVTGLNDLELNSNIIVRNNYIHNNSLAAWISHQKIYQEEILNHPIFHFSNNTMTNNGHQRIIDKDDWRDQQMSNKEAARFKFPEFELKVLNLFQDFWQIMNGNKVYYEYDPESGRMFEVAMPENSERGYDDYLISIKAHGDTLELSLSDYFYEDDLTFIITPERKDSCTYHLSMAYLSFIQEYEYDKNVPVEELSLRHTKWIQTINEQTPFVALKNTDENTFQFKFNKASLAKAYGEDNAATIPADYNSVNWHYSSLEKNRIKTKYNFKDSQIIFRSEYGLMTHYLKNGNAFSYTPDAYLFRIDRIKSGEALKSYYIKMNMYEDF